MTVSHVVFYYTLVSVIYIQTLFPGISNKSSRGHSRGQVRI